MAAPARRVAPVRGFTLIEVMISIFLVLLLIVGINQAFKVVSQTVGAGQSLSSKSRDSFTVQSALTQEIGRALVHELDHRPGQANQAGAGQQPAQAGDHARQLRIAGLGKHLRGAVEQGRAQRVDEMGHAPGGDAAHAARHPRHVEE